MRSWIAVARSASAIGRLLHDLPAAGIAHPSNVSDDLCLALFSDCARLELRDDEPVQRLDQDCEPFMRALHDLGVLLE